MLSGQGKRGDCFLPPTPIFLCTKRHGTPISGKFVDQEGSVSTMAPKAHSAQHLCMRIDYIPSNYSSKRGFYNDHLHHHSLCSKMTRGKLLCGLDHLPSFFAQTRRTLNYSSICLFWPWLGLSSLVRLFSFLSFSFFFPRRSQHQKHTPSLLLYADWTPQYIERYAAISLLIPFFIPLSHSFVLYHHITPHFISIPLYNHVINISYTCLCHYNKTSGSHDYRHHNDDSKALGSTWFHRRWYGCLWSSYAHQPR